MELIKVDSISEGSPVQGPNPEEKAPELIPVEVPNTRLAAEDRPAYRSAEMTKQILEGGDLDQAMRVSQGDVEWSLKMTRGINPDTAARVKKIAEAVRMPEDTVNRNLGTAEEMAQAEEALKVLTATDEKGDFKHPYAVAWLSNPEKMKLAKDDVAALTEIEKAIRRSQKEDQGIIGQTGGALMYGIANVNASLAKLPAGAYDAFAYPQNKLAEILNMPELQVRAPEWLRNNYAKKYYDNAAEYYKPLQMDESIVGQVRDGKIQDAAKNLYLQVVSQAPQLAALAMTGAATGEIQSLTAMGAMEYADAIDRANVDGKKSPAKAFEGALGRGFAEGFFEKYTLGMLKGFGKQLTETVGKQTAKEVLKEMAKHAGKDFYGEGMSELQTSVAQDFADYATGDKSAMEGSVARALDAFLVGGAMGGGMATMSVAVSARAKQAEYMRQAQEWAQAEAQAEASKLRARSPEAFEDFVSSAIGKASPNVYVPAEAVQAFAQKKAPEEVQMLFKELGIEEQVAEAEKTGQDIEIPKAKWLAKVVGTDFAKAMKDEIRFDQNGMNAREQGELKAATEKQIAEMKAEFDALQAEEKLPAKVTAIREKMLAAKDEGGFGMKAEDADAQLSVLLAGAKILSKQTGETVDQWFDRVNPVLGVGGQVEAEALNQSVKSAEPKNLVTVHNLTESNLAHADKVGGLAVPSLAVTKKEHPLENFGEISLIAKPEIMKSPRAKTFNADVYSPRYPNVRYKVSSKELSKAFDSMGIPEDLAREYYNESDSNEIGKEGLTGIENGTLAKYAFLKEKGVNVEPVRNKPQLDWLKIAPKIQDIVDQFDAPGEMADRPGFKEEFKKLYDKYVAKHLKEYKDADVKAEHLAEIEQDYKELFFMDGNVEAGVPSHKAMMEIRREIRSIKDKGTIDRVGTREKLRKAIKGHEAEFTAWVKEKFGHTIKSEQIARENDDGDIRWVPHTLENVVKEMRRKLRSGEGFNYGVGNIRAKVAKQFKSIREVQKDRANIITEEQMKTLKDEVNSEFFKLYDDHFKPYLKAKDTNDFRQFDNFSEHLHEMVDAGSRAITEYYDNLPEESIKAAADFLDKLRNMPSEYFEVKIQRAVQLNEFAAAVAPDTISPTTLEILQKHGLKVALYKAKDPKSRAKAIASLEESHPDIFFQSAFHGSPHDFDKFTLQKIGTGEGAQAYGWGLYFASDRGVAEWYKKNLAKGRDFAGLTEEENRAIPDYVSNLVNLFGMKELDKHLQDYQDRVISAAGALKSPDAVQPHMIEIQLRTAQSVANALFKLRELGDPKGKGKTRGKLYKVEIPESEDMLDWDTPIKDQSPKARAILEATDAYKAADKRANESEGKFKTGAQLTGQEFYGGLQHYEGMTQEEASKYLLSIGIPGLKYADGNTRNSNEVNHNFVIFDDSLVQITDKFDQGGDEIRGQVQFKNGQTIISMFKSANFSTFLHETAHVFAWELERMHALGTLDEKSEADYKALVDFAGGKLDRAGHEKIAEAFEMYLREGKAPSIKLASAFQKFRAWLMAIYRSLKGHVEPSDEIREVFDRLLASEAEIEEAKRYFGAKRDLMALIPADKAKVAKSPTEQLDLPALKEKADAEALDAQVKKYMKAFLEAIGGRQKITEHATREIEEMPVYKALDDAAARGGIDFKMVSETGEDMLADLREKHKGALGKQNGKVTLGELAIEHGFESEDALLAAIRDANPKSQAIKARAREIMLQHELNIRHEMAGQEKVPGEEAYHSPSRLTYLIAEAELIAQKLEGEKQQKLRRLEAKVFEDAALDAVNKKQVRTATRYDLYSKAEQKFANQAYDLAEKGDLVEAHEAKKKQILNHALVKAAIQAKEDRAKIEARYKPKSFKAKLKNVESAFAEIATDLALTYGLAEGDGKMRDQADLVKVLSALDENLVAQLPTWVLKREKAGDYRSLTMGELRELDAAIQSIMHLGRDALTSMENTQWKTITDFVGESVKRMEALKDAKIYREHGFFDETFQKVRDLMGHLNMLDFTFERLDNYEFTRTQKAGPLRKLFNEGVKREAKYNDLKTRVHSLAAPHWQVLAKAARRLEAKYKGTFFDIPGVPMIPGMQKLGREQWTAERVISFVLNMGNEGNLAAMEKAYGYTPDQMNLIAGQLTNEELKAIQGVWDATNVLFPELDATHFRVYNRHLGKVLPKPFTVSRTASGADGIKLEGGYYPLVFDHKLNDQAGKYFEDDMMKNRTTAVFRSTKPEDGMTYSRVPGHALPPKLELSVWTAHISDTARYISHAEYLRDLNRITTNKEWKSAFQDKTGRSGKGKDLYSQLRGWVQFQAHPEVINDGGGAAQFFSNQRSRASVVTLGFSPRTALKQLQAHFSTAQEIGWRWLLSGLKEQDAKSLIGLDGKVFDQIAEVSPYIRTRNKNIDREIRDAVGEFNPMIKRFNIAGHEFTLQDLREFSFVMIDMVDKHTVSIGWRGAFNKYLHEHRNEPNHDQVVKDAIEYADTVIRTTQQSSLPIEKNALQRSVDGILRLLTMFMTWQFKWNGRIAHHFRAYKEGAIDITTLARHVAYEHVMGPWLSLGITALIGFEAPEWYEWLLAPGENAIGGLPLVREIPGGAKFGRNVGNSPAFEGLNRVSKAGKTTIEWLEGDKEYYQALWDVGRVVEFYTGVPALKVAKSLHDTYKNIKGEGKH